MIYSIGTRGVTWISSSFSVRNHTNIVIGDISGQGLTGKIQYIWSRKCVKIFIYGKIYFWIFYILCHFCTIFHLLSDILPCLFSQLHMRSPVNKSYILTILRQKPETKSEGMVLGVAVGFFYKPWVIFSQRKSFNFFSIFFHTFWAHRSFFRTVLVRIPLMAP